MRKWIYLLGTVICVASLIYFFWFVSRNAGGLPEVTWTASDVLLLLGLVVLSAASIYWSGWAWRFVLRAMNPLLAKPEHIWIFMMSNMAKYIPGNVAHFLGRAALAKQSGLPGRMIVSSMVVETAILLLVGLGMGHLITIAADADFFSSVSREFPIAGLVWGLLFAGFLVLILYLVFSFRRGELNLGGKKGWTSAVICGIATNFVTLSLQAFSIEMCMQLLFDQSVGNFPLLLGVNALAFVLGLLTPGAPAGLGVRESVLLAFMTPLVNAGPAAAVILLSRMVSVLSDALGFLVSWFVYGRTLFRASNST